jgi:uncharacterized membrane protein
VKCPRCGEPVSQFAAGCAICGADLEAARQERAARGVHVHVPSVSVGRRLPLDWWVVPAIGLVAVIMPLFGILLAMLAAYQRDQAGDRGMRNAYVAVAVIALIVFIIPPLRFGVAQLLFS